MEGVEHDKRLLGSLLGIVGDATSSRRAQSAGMPEAGCPTGRLPVVARDDQGSQCAADWLQATFPGLKDVSGHLNFRAVDLAVWQAGSAAFTTYALICGVLFGSADEAMTAISSGQMVLPITARELAANMPAEAWRALYREHEGSVWRIHGATGLRPRVIVDRLSTLGLAGLHTTHGRSLRSAIESFLVGGVSLAESAARAKVPIDSLEAALRRACGPLRQELQFLKPAATRSRALRYRKKETA
jgi:hypothetical protein